MAERDDARTGWLALRRRGQTRIAIGCSVAVAVVFAIGLLAGADAPLAAAVVLIAVAAVGGGSFWLWQRHTGTSLAPDWAPERTRDGSGSDDLASGRDAVLPTPAPAAPAGPPPDHFDAQILGSDLVRLGQTVPEGIRRSYATGNLVVAGGELRWEPAPITAKRGVAAFVIDRGQLDRIDVSELWGSWSLVSLARTDGSTVGLRVPSGARPREALAAR